MIIDEDLYIKRMKTLPQNRMKEIAVCDRGFSDMFFWENQNPFWEIIPHSGKRELHNIRRCCYA